FEIWDWAGVDLTVESIWKGEERRENSIQGRVAEHYTAGGFEVVFDDDASGEAADLVCMREEGEWIRVALVHCKFSGGADPGRRVKDVVEVASQAVRSAKWKWRFRELCRHLTHREKLLKSDARPSRFIVGDSRALNRLSRLNRFKGVKAEVVIVQPGISVKQLSPDQRIVFASAHSFLKETVDVDIDVICSE